MSARSRLGRTAHAPSSCTAFRSTLGGAFIRATSLARRLSSSWISTSVRRAGDAASASASARGADATAIAGVEFLSGGKSARPPDWLSLAPACSCADGADERSAAFSLAARRSFAAASCDA